MAPSPTRHLSTGRAHAGQPVPMLMDDIHVITSHAATGEVVAEHHIAPTATANARPDHSMTVDPMSRDIHDNPREPTKKS